MHRFQVDAKRRPFLIGCDIHVWMRAWVFVFDHPYFSVADAEGSFQIDGFCSWRVLFLLQEVGSSLIIVVIVLSSVVVNGALLVCPFAHFVCASRSAATKNGCSA